MRTPSLPRLGLTLALFTLGSCGPTEPEEVDPRFESFDEGPGTGGSGGKADGTAWTNAYGPLPANADLNRPLQVLFTPDEPATTLELAMIDRVIQARKADSRTFTEGQNPYRVRYAVYNLRNQQVVTRLADANDAGVDVQILIDIAQLDPSRPWNMTDEYLVGRGFEMVADHRKATETQRRTADLIGIWSPGLMHLKTRLYETPSEQALLTGSFNPGDESVYNEETLHLIRDKTTIARYVAAYDNVIRGAPIANTWTEGQAINVLFTPEASGPKAGAQILSWLASEKEQILLSVFSLRDISAAGVSSTLVTLLADKVKAGVPVYVLTDKKQSDGVEANGMVSQPDDKTEDRLRAAGVRVYEVMNTQTLYTAMHHKVAILGRTKIRVITDASNWTQAALGSATKKAVNTESVLFLDTDKLDGGLTGRRYLGQWLRVLSRWAGQSQGVEADYGTTYTKLTGLSGWPTQPVQFVADNAMTSPGEEVRAVGEVAALGAWEQGALGLSLATTAMEYPTWRGGPARLPVGPFSFKFAVGQKGQKVYRWEGGANRMGLALPNVLAGEAQVVYRGSFQ